MAPTLSPNHYQVLKTAYALARTGGLLRFVFHSKLLYKMINDSNNSKLYSTNLSGLFETELMKKKLCYYDLRHQSNTLITMRRWLENFANKLQRRDASESSDGTLNLIT
jgi:hypothetical protein